ncbi:GNAT family N-acetyltransferase [uncultured Agathobaculum sp.]|uniref:GNAT family N-acetyltransferase n=1 Tax=uncultured Agathobaculum sp. TaxID=2048140 RepID=UPI00320A6D24
MASHPDFVNFVAEQLREAGTIRSRKMFGEYGLYCDEVFFAVICDDQFFVKITPQGEAAFPDLPKAPPYEGANDSFLVEDVENQELMTRLTRITCEALRSKPQRKRNLTMKIRLAQAQDIDAWMALVEQVRDIFPGLETAEAITEHRATVLRFIKHSSAVCAVGADRIIGVLLFSKEQCELCFLAVDPACRRQHIAHKLVSFVLAQMDADQDITVTTYREDDPNGQEARAFYKHLGFSEGRLTEEFGHPVQEFILKRQSAGHT